MFNRDVPNGIDVDDFIKTRGLTSAFTNSGTPPPAATARCYLWDVLGTCTEQQTNTLEDGTGIIEDFILVGKKTSDETVVFNNGTVVFDNSTMHNSPSTRGSLTASSAVPTVRGGQKRAASLVIIVVAAISLWLTF